MDLKSYTENIYIIPILIFSVVIHEMAHAWVNVTYMSDADYRAEVNARRQQLGLTTQQQ